MTASLGNWVAELLKKTSLNELYINYTKNAIIFLAIVMLAVLVHYVARYIILNIIKRIAKRTTTTWDDVLVTKRVFHRLAYVVPAFVIHALMPVTLGGYDVWIEILQGVIKIYIIIIFLRVIEAFSSSVNSIYSDYGISRTRPITGYIQVVKIILYSVGIILILSILINRNPITLFAGLGAISAVLILVFKDTLLGFVASIQLSSNDMVRIGDWVAVPKYGADGTVTSINLTTVKVQNWDKTISTVPTYSMISDSFQNWRGMEESGGRRIKRSININMDSVTFCTPEMLDKFRKIHLVKPYIEAKQKELIEYNEKNKIDNSILVNGRRQTNIGVFRAYLVHYLRNHPQINTEMTFLIRQLQPTDIGIPIEIYVFSKVQEWGKYEDIQADIFDHILAVVPEFDLQVFQSPSGTDFQHLLGNN